MTQNLPSFAAVLALLASSMTAQPARAADDLAPSTITRVTLERTPCLGMCPSYTVTASRDGAVAFEGRDNVKLTGKHAGRVPAKDFDAIAAAVARVNFMLLNDTYMTADDGCQEVHMDNPSIKITVQAGGRTKQVWYDLGCKGAPPEKDIAWLADTIDGKARSAQWTGAK